MASYRVPLVVALLGLPALLAACTLPGEEQPFGDALRTNFEPIRGLTPEHARSHPVDIALSPDGKKAYVALSGTIARPDNRVAVVDLTRGRLIGHLEVGVRPTDIATDPLDANRLLVTSAYSPVVTFLDMRDDEVVEGVRRVPYYSEYAAWSPDGGRLVLSNRDEDVVVTFEVSRQNAGPVLSQKQKLATGPNPAQIVFLDQRLAAVADRHGASVTLLDLDELTTRRVPVGGPPLALAAQDGILFVAGITGDGVPGTGENGTADLENSLLALDLRAGAALVDQEADIPTLRYVSDTARPDRAESALRILGGATPRALVFQDDLLWVVHHGSDQVQSLLYHKPAPDQALNASLLTTPGGTSGARFSHIGSDLPLAPGRLTDTAHGIYETPPGPRAVARSGDRLLVVAELSEELQVLALSDCPGPSAPTNPCTERRIPLVDDPLPYPSGAYEEGERLFVSALPSADQDRSCASCHVDGLASGGTWALPHRDYTPLRIPRLDATANNAPWLVDGSVERPAEYLEAAGGGLLEADPDDPSNLAARTADSPPGPNATPGERRFPDAGPRLALIVENATTPEAYMDLTFAYALGEERLLPVPPRRADDAAAENGMRLFAADTARCSTCHGDASTARLLAPGASDPIPRPPGADAIKAPQLVGLWDREGTGYLYDGRAATLYEALLPEGHRCLADGQDGLGSDWHGNLDRRCDAIDNLVVHLLTLNGRR